MEKAEARTLDKVRELVGDAALWPRMRDFLWDFAPQVHPSWLEEPAVGWFGCEDSPRVKRFILASLGVEPFFHDFPKDDGSRLALLDGATLLDVAKWLGALACAAELRRITDGATVRALKAALPGVYPDVFAFTAYFAALDLAPKGGADVSGEKAPERVVAEGLGLLFARLGACPAPVVARLKMKLPRDLADLCVGKDRPAAAPALKKLLKLKFPEAYSLCCS